MNNYFEGCGTVEEIKKTYKQWAMKLHPDVGGSTAQMQQLNAQYEAALKRCDGQKSVDNEGKEHTYRYNEGLEREIVEKIDSLLQLKMEGVDIWLIGTWIWVKGDTKPYKEQLKAVECRWSSKHLSWYWRREEDRTWRSSGKSLDGIAAIYGAAKITQKEKDKNKAIAS